LSEINDIQDFLEGKFPEKWINNYLSEEYLSDENPDKESLGKEHLDDKKLEKDVIIVVDYVFDKFCVSTLKGEYISDEKLSVEIKKLDAFLDGNFDVYIEAPSIQNEILKLVKERLVGTIKVFTKTYLNFLKLLETYHKYPQLDIISVSSPSIQKYLPKEEHEDTFQKLNFYHYLVLLNKYDHFFGDTIEFYENLIQLDNFIAGNKIVSKYRVVLKEKIQFLKYKWETRHRTLFSENTNTIKGYIVDNELFISNEKPINTSNNEKIIQWGDHIESHYEIGDWKYKIHSDVAKMDISNIETLSFLEIHKLIKYYKDVKPNYHNLSEIVDLLKEKTNKEEVYTFNKIYNYALNNQFSLLLEQEDIKEEEIVPLKRRIENFQSRCKTDNFFVEYKYISHLIKKVEFEYENRKEFDNIESTTKTLNRLDELIESCGNKLIWSQNHYNHLFQLPYNECLVSSNLKELPDVYYASSFVLPLPLEESQKEFNSINKKYNRLNSLVSSVSSLNKEFNTIKELKENLKANDFRSLEIIGVFTAIVAFVLASIPSFKFITTFNQAALFTSILACSLFLLTFTILSFTRGIDKVMKNLWFIISVVLLFLFSIFIFSKDKKPKKEEVKKKETSVSNKIELTINDVNYTKNSKRVDSVEIISSLKKSPKSN